MAHSNFDRLALIDLMWLCLFMTVWSDDFESRAILWLTWLSAMKTTINTTVLIKSEWMRRCDGFLFALKKCCNTNVFQSTLIIVLETIFIELPSWRHDRLDIFRQVFRKIEFPCYKIIWGLFLRNTEKDISDALPNN